MSFKSFLKSFGRSSQDIPKNLYENDTSLPEGKDISTRLELLSRERRTSVPARRPLPTVKKIAVCLVIVNELRHENIWKEWVESSRGNPAYEASLFIHAKLPEEIRSTWVRSKLIAQNFHPEWNSTEVVRAMLAVLEHAVDCSGSERFIFATESCIPIYDLPTMADMLFAEDKSWLNARDEPESSWERANCFEAVNTRIVPRGAVWKALPGWIMLTRRHAMDIIGLLRHTGGYALDRRHDGISSTDLVRAFGPPGQWHKDSDGVFAPEEVFFATMLGLLGYLQRGYEKLSEVKQLSISYATWARRGDANPQVISDLNANQLERMRRTGALMARKFDKSDRLFYQWKQLILPKSESRLSNIDSKSVAMSSSSSVSVSTSAAVHREEPNSIGTKRPREDGGAVGNDNDAVETEAKKQKHEALEATTTDRVDSLQDVIVEEKEPGEI